MISIVLRASGLHSLSLRSQVMKYNRTSFSGERELQLSFLLYSFWAKAMGVAA